VRDVVIHSRFLEKPLLWGAVPRMIIDVYTIGLKAIESTFASVGAYLKAPLNFFPFSGPKSGMPDLVYFLLRKPRGKPRSLSVLGQVTAMRLA